jgi:hypothetical protein
MPILTVADPELAWSFLQQVELPAPPRREVRRGGEVVGLRGATAGVGQALAVGSQFTEFAGGVPPGMRADIVNSFLVAQLAANEYLRAFGGGTREWYERFSLVLANSGWNVEKEPETTRDLSGSSQQMYREIIPIVSAALGGAVAAKSILMATLKGLAAMSPDHPWITLFNRESQRASANQFQIGYLEAAEGKAARGSLTSFELDAQQSVTQVLFFRFTETRATLRYSTSTITMNEGVFARVKDLVEERIREHLATFIAGVEL